MSCRPLRNLAKTASEVVTPATTSSCGSFDLAPHHVQLRDIAKRFTREEIIPVAAEHDNTMKFPWKVMQRAHEEKLLNLSVPFEYGNTYRDKLSQVIVAEEIGYGCTGVALAMFINELSMTPLVLAGSHQLKDRFLSRMGKQPLMAAYCVTEPSAGSDVAGVKTKAIRDGHDYIINGSKMWISNGGVADWYFVLARTDLDPSTPSGRAFSAFVIPTGTKGLELGKKEINMGQRCSDTRAVTFDDVRVPKEYMVGAPGEGFKIVMRTFDMTRPLVAAMATGLMSRCLDESISHIRDINANGEAVIQQMTQFKLADMTMNVEMSRMLCYKSAANIDSGTINSYYSSLAKAFAAEKANEAAASTVEILGHHGYSAENNAEKLFRDAKIFQIYGGTTQIQKLIVARQVLQRSVNNAV